MLENMTDKRGKVINFAPGPAKIPVEVITKVQSSLLDYDNTGCGVMELSHRSAEFEEIYKAAMCTVTKLMNIPSNHKVLFLAGGSVGQFSAIVWNLIRCRTGGSIGGSTDGSSGGIADYVVTGNWSEMAAAEAEQLTNLLGFSVRYVLPRATKGNYVDLASTDPSLWTYDPAASYVYYCANETIHGIEICDIGNVPPNVPVVCDMSSCILSRTVDVSKFGVIFACAQKNLGCAGVTLAIVRDDLLDFCIKGCPSIWNYKKQVEMNCCYNTPPTFNIYVMKLTLDWAEEQGGPSKLEHVNQLKAALIYDVIDKSEGFYCCAVPSKLRSNMNIPFRVGGRKDMEDMEKRFLCEADSCGLLSLKGHRSVGGMRASLYNAVTLEEAKTLAEFMMDFQKRHGTS